MIIDHNTSRRPVDPNDGPYWPAVEWGAAAIVAIGLFLFLPGAAWLIAQVAH